jgi:succinate dehydrogenase / fumarate reductase, flavoprotein subunit
MRRILSWRCDRDGWGAEGNNRASFRLLDLFQLRARLPGQSDRCASIQKSEAYGVAYTVVRQRERLMTNAETWERIESDVLVIGGGFGGLWSALRAAECGASVVLVDKSFAGKSGHSYFASGARMVLLPDDNLDDYVYDVVQGNEWLVEQDMVTAVFEGSYQRLKDVESLGMSFRKKNGAYVWTKARGTTNVKNLWLEHATAGAEVTLLRNVALSRGVRIINHVYIYDLLQDRDGDIVGAAGLGVKEQRHYLFSTKSTVVATNSGGYRGHHLASELQGTGPFMAYDAGARLKNPEFHYINIRPAMHEIEGSGILPAIGGRWINAEGMHFMEAYDPVLKDRAPASKIVVSAALEAMKGNAPISIDVRGMTEEEREHFRLLIVSHGWQPLLFEKCMREEGYDILRDNIEWQPAYESNKLGIDADMRGKTSLNGLFAAGMARTLGINPFTGWSIASSTWSGYAAGESAAEYADCRPAGKIDQMLANDLRRKFFEPMAVETGVHPDLLVHTLQTILFTVDVLIIMNEPKLKEALDTVIELKREELPRLKATDTRTLIKSKETQTMVLSAEMSLRAALMRKETRENIFYRADFSGPDNDHWLKWITVTKGEDGQMQFRTDHVPFERYKFRPAL